ncbi:fucolectin-4, partial [Biomphalaria glabrata]
RNIALKQPSNQTSNIDKTYSSDKAVDGNTSGTLSEGSCTHTNGSETSPKWTLYLNHTFLVNKFVLYNR